MKHAASPALPSAHSRRSSCHVGLSRPLSRSHALRGNGVTRRSASLPYLFLPPASCLLLHVSCLLLLASCCILLSLSSCINGDSGGVGIPNQITPQAPAQESGNPVVGGGDSNDSINESGSDGGSSGSGSSGSSGSGTGSDSSSGGVAAPPTGGDGTTPPGGSNGGAGPQASIPAPSATIGGVLAVNCDSEGVCIIYGKPGSVLCPSLESDGYMCQVAILPDEVGYFNVVDRSSTLARLAISNPASQLTSQLSESLALGFGRVLSLFGLHPTPVIDAQVAAIFNSAKINRRPVNPGEMLISMAHAQEGDIPETPPDLAADLCARADSLECCNVETDGSFLCAPTGNNSTTFHLAVTNGTSATGSTPFTPNSKLLYTSLAVKSLAPNSGMVGEAAYAVTDDLGVAIQNDGGILRMMGHHEFNYVAFSATNAGEIAIDSTDFTLRLPAQQISEVDNTDIATSADALEDLLLEAFDSCPARPPDPDGPGGALQPEADCRHDSADTRGFSDLTAPPAEAETVTEALRYNILKRASNGGLYFGIRTSRPERGQIYWAKDPSDARTVTFLTSAESDALTVNHNETIAFDCDENDNCVVVFRDGDNYRLRLRVSPPDGVRFGGETALVEGDNDFRDIIIVNNTLAGGKALLVDALQNKLWVINYVTLDGAISITSNLVAGINDVTVGTRPVGIAVNAAKTRAFVLNQGSKDITVLSLTNGGTVRPVPTFIKTVPLSSYVPSSFNVVPTDIALSGEQVLVGTDGDFKGIINIPLADL